MATMPDSTSSPDLEMQTQPSPSDPPTRRDSHESISTAEENGFRYADDYKKYPAGWPRLAAEQNNLENGSNHRRHGYLFQRSLCYQDGRLSWLEKKLIEREENEESQGGDMAASQLKSLLPGQKRAVGTPLTQSDEKDFFLESVTEDLIRYAQLMLCDAQLRKLHPIPEYAHRSLFNNYVKNNEMLDENGRNFLQCPNDLVTTMTDRVHSPLEWLLYSRTDNFLVKLLSKKKTGEDNDDSFARTLSTRPLQAVITVTMISASGGLLLAPVAILYIVQLTKPASIGVVAAFALVFTTAISIKRGIKAETIFLGLSAYLAVLVTFLANIQGGCQGS